ncbi:tetratricopeptide repeat protein [Roseivirga echinicomitans]
MRKFKYFYLILILLMTTLSCESEKAKAGRFLLMGNNELGELNYKEAIRLYTEAITKDPLFKEAYNNRGVAYFKTGRYAEALNDYTFAIIQIDPTYADAYKNRFEVSLVSGNFNRALEDAEFLNKSFPDSAYTYLYEGLALTELKRYDEAVFKFDMAHQKDPKNVEPVVNQANAYYLSGRYDEARRLLRTAMTIDASEPIIYNTLALIATQEGDFEEALKHVNQALEIDNRNPYFNNNRGFIYLNLGELEKAEIDINMGIRLDPRNPWAYRNKAIFYYESKSFDAALRNVELAAKYDETVPLLNRYWGLILVELGRAEEACIKFDLTETPDKEELIRKYCK